MSSWRPDSSNAFSHIEVKNSKESPYICSNEALCDVEYLQQEPLPTSGEKKCSSLCEYASIVVEVEVKGQTKTADSESVHVFEDGMQVPCESLSQCSQFDINANEGLGPVCVIVHSEEDNTPLLKKCFVSVQQNIFMHGGERPFNPQNTKNIWDQITESTKMQSKEDKFSHVAAGVDLRDIQRCVVAVLPVPLVYDLSELRRLREESAYMAKYASVLYEFLVDLIDEMQFEPHSVAEILVNRHDVLRTVLQRPRVLASLAILRSFMQKWAQVRPTSEKNIDTEPHKIAVEHLNLQIEMINTYGRKEQDENFKQTRVRIPPFYPQDLTRHTEQLFCTTAEKKDTDAIIASLARTDTFPENILGKIMQKIETEIGQNSMTTQDVLRYMFLTLHTQLAQEPIACAVDALAQDQADQFLKNELFPYITKSGSQRQGSETTPSNRKELASLYLLQTLPLVPNPCRQEQLATLQNEATTWTTRDETQGEFFHIDWDSKKKPCADVEWVTAIRLADASASESQLLQADAKCDHILRCRRRLKEPAQQLNQRIPLPVIRPAMNSRFPYLVSLAIDTSRARGHMNVSGTCNFARTQAAQQSKVRPPDVFSVSGLDRTNNTSWEAIDAITRVYMQEWRDVDKSDLIEKSRVLPTTAALVLDACVLIEHLFGRASPTFVGYENEMFTTRAGLVSRLLLESFSTWHLAVAMLQSKTQQQRTTIWNARCVDSTQQFVGALRRLTAAAIGKSHPSTWPNSYLFSLTDDDLCRVEASSTIKRLTLMLPAANSTQAEIVQKNYMEDKYATQPVEKESVSRTLSFETKEVEKTKAQSEDIQTHSHSRLRLQHLWTGRLVSEHKIKNACLFGAVYEARPGADVYPGIVDVVSVATGGRKINLPHLLKLCTEIDTDDTNGPVRSLFLSLKPGDVYIKHTYTCPEKFDEAQEAGCFKGDFKRWATSKHPFQIQSFKSDTKYSIITVPIAHPHQLLCPDQSDGSFNAEKNACLKYNIDRFIQVIGLAMSLSSTDNVQRIIVSSELIVESVLGEACLQFLLYGTKSSKNLVKIIPFHETETSFATHIGNIKKCKQICETKTEVALCCLDDFLAVYSSFE